MPGLTIGDTVPNLEVESTHGVMKLHEYIGDSWTILFSHPGDFTPVCTTELGKMAAYAEEFAKKVVKLLGLSHVEWIKDIEAYTPVAKVTYTIIADPDRRFVKELNMVDPDEKDNSGNILPSRALHVVGPDKKIKLSFLYPATTGRNMDDVMRVVESLQRASKHKIATPVNWKPGENVVISPNVSNEEAKKMFPQGYKTVDLTFHPTRNTCASLMLTPSKVHHCNGVCSLSGHVSSCRTYMNTLLTVFIIACDPFVKLD